MTAKAAVLLSWFICWFILNFFISMFLLIPAHLGCPGQNPKSRKTVVCVCVCVCEEVIMPSVL